MRTALGRSNSSECRGEPDVYDVENMSIREVE
jgi:hypothetical protein